MADTELTQSILRTIAYFDILGRPLTKEELLHFLWQPPGGGAVHELPPGDLVQEKDGYYFLPGRGALVESFRESSAVSEQKLRRARRVVKLLRSIPFLKAVFVSSSVAAGTASPESDIDFFIITEPKRIWIVRFFCNLTLRLLGLRVYGKKKKNRVCLCFFVDTVHLDLAPWRIAEDDIHFAYWLHQMIPIYDPENYHQKFIEANGWTRRFLPNILIAPIPDVRQGADNTDGRIGKLWKKIWEKMWDGAYGNLIEKEAKKLQWGMMKMSLKEKAKFFDHHVVITDGVLKLHENDTRRRYREQWLAVIARSEERTTKQPPG